MAELDTELFEAPGSEGNRAGLRTWERVKTPYLEFLESEGIPIITGIGVHNVRELDLGHWARLGGNGAFLYLDGNDGLKGMYVLEIPGGGVINPERHLYHEFYLVLEGRGTTETWVEGSDKKQITEWQPGSLMYFPPNVTHRLVNATKERVLIIATNNAPPIWNIHRDAEFIFNNDYIFKAHYSEDDDFYKFDEKVYKVPVNQRAQTTAELLPRHHQLRAAPRQPATPWLPPDPAGLAGIRVRPRRLHLAVSRRAVTAGHTSTQPERSLSAYEVPVTRSTGTSRTGQRRGRMATATRSRSSTTSRVASSPRPQVAETGSTSTSTSAASTSGSSTTGVDRPISGGRWAGTTATRARA